MVTVLVFLFIAATMLVLPLVVIPEPPLAVLFVLFVVTPLLLLFVVFGARQQPRKWSLAVATLLALFVVVSYPIGTKRARDDATQCEDRRPAGQGSVEYCIQERREQRRGPWQAWGSNRSAD